MRMQRMAVTVLALLALGACARKTAQAPPVPREQAYYEAMNEGIEALGAEDFAKAEAAFNKQAELFPKDPTAPYNLACAHARAGRSDQAMEALERSVALGWDDWEHMGLDTDLESLRGDPRFQKAVEAVKARGEAFDREWDPILRADLQTGRDFKTIKALLSHYAGEEKKMEQALFGLSSFGQKERRYRLANEKMGSLMKLDWKADAQAFAEVLRLHREFGREADREEGVRIYEEFLARYPEGDLAAEARYEHAAALANVEATCAEGLAGLDAVAEAFPQSPWGGRAMLTLAREAQKSGDLERAYPYAKTVLEKFSGDREIGWQAGELRTILFAKDGLPEPAVSDWDGKPVTLAEYEGKVLMLDFWATWCKPCVEEIPQVRAAYDRFHDQGLEIVSVSLDHKMKPAKLRKYCKEKGMDWRHIYEDKPWDATIAAKYHVRAIPTMILMDRSGGVHAGERGEALLAQVGALVAR
jgi:thiol-disulfide isomerase/thioredoxin